MKITVIMLLVAFTSTAWAEPANQPRPENQRMVLRLDDQRKVVVEKEKPELLRLFDYSAPHGAEKLIVLQPANGRMITWR